MRSTLTKIFIMFCAFLVITQASNAFFVTKLPEYPQLSLITVDGKKFDLSQKRNKAVLVFFWTSWCGNCRQEIAVLNKVYPSYRDKDFEIIGISLDEKNEQEKAIKIAQSLPFSNALIEDNRGHESINEFGEPNLIPTNYLIDKNGKLHQELMPRIGFTEENFAPTIDKLLEAK